jgi:hypothetical protein
MLRCICQIHVISKNVLKVVKLNKVYNFCFYLTLCLLYKPSNYVVILFSFATSRLRAGRLGFQGSSSGGSWEFSLHRVQKGSETHSASYPMGNGSSFPGGKATGTWNWPLTSILCQDEEWVGYTSTPPIRLHGVVLRFKNTGTTLPLKSDLSPMQSVLLGR